MRSFRHLVRHVETYGLRHQALYFFCLVILFWAIFDGITTYVVPLVLTQNGLSKTQMGLIYASSSFFGAIFDFLMCKFVKNSYYRRLFLLMFGLSFLYLLTLAIARTVLFFLLAMMLWGFYYDLKNFGSYDFIARFTKSREHSSSFGVLTVFQAAGYLIGPLIAGFLIAERVELPPFIAAGIFLLISFIMLIFIFRKEKAYPQEIIERQYNYKGFLNEIGLWLKIDRVLLPVLLMATILNIVDAFFWTVGPLLAESFASYHQFAGLFLSAYELPALFVGWFVGSVTRKFGKKRTSFISLLGGSLLLSSIGYVNSPMVLVLIVFLSSALMSFAWPALRGVFADYINETGKYEKEIEGLEDLYTNVGYIIGPALAGFLADQIGNAKTFTVLGVAGALVAAYLLKVTPRKINVLKQMGTT